VLDPRPSLPLTSTGNLALLHLRPSPNLSFTDGPVESEFQMQTLQNPNADASSSTQTFVVMVSKAKPAAKPAASPAAASPAAAPAAAADASPAPATPVEPQPETPALFSGAAPLLFSPVLLPYVNGWCCKFGANDQERDAPRKFCAALTQVQTNPPGPGTIDAVGGRRAVLSGRGRAACSGPLDAVIRGVGVGASHRRRVGPGAPFSCPPPLVLIELVWGLSNGGWLMLRGLLSATRCLEWMCACSHG